MVPWLRAVCVSLLVAAPAFAHDEATLDTHNRTPGAHLELLEVPPSGSSGGPRFSLRATGIASRGPFEVWTQDFGNVFRRVASGLRVDDLGKVVQAAAASPSGQALLPGPVALGPGPYPRGAAWTVALVATDRSTRVFASAIPRPIVGRNRSCMVELELVSPLGDRFVATGTGFPPGRRVTAEVRSPDRVVEKQQRASTSGRLPLNVLFHRADDPSRRARYVVKCDECEVAIEYEWGAAALSRN
ncbi:MAG TPA: hypothetical protein VMG58_00655 [Candidatus Sulfotelmatobacter sp.]|nr:hypothetical protein [Candidatus Sulfotelmatobacter sp.]